MLLILIIILIQSMTVIYSELKFFCFVTKYLLVFYDIETGDKNYGISMVSKLLIQRSEMNYIENFLK